MPILFNFIVEIIYRNGMYIFENSLKRQKKTPRKTLKFNFKNVQ